MSLSGLGIERGDILGGNLLVESLLGRGGMAEVYQVRDVTDGSRHALKVLASEDENIRKRIFKEGELIASLTSPFVVQLRGELRVEGRPALLMERVRGPTLSRYLKATQPPLKYAMALFRGMCMGVGSAHAMGIVHRDLKPGNVLLHIDEHRVIPKVVDFGVAKDLISGLGLTVARSAYGTPRFMAPEQFDDSATVDRRADMWALGVILYRLVCGRLPFDAAPEDLLLQVTLGRYKPPREHVADLPEEVVFAIEELLQRRVEERIPDVATLFGMLDGRTALAREAALGTLPVKARAPFTQQPTAIPLKALPTELRDILEQQKAWEADSEPPEATQAAPPPPDWAGDDSMLPRTMTPDSVDRMHAVPIQPPPPVRTASLVPEVEDAAADSRSDAWYIAVGSMIGGIGALTVFGAVLALWFAAG